MDENARELVRRLLQEGMRYDAVRREIISHGYSTEGFESEYPDIQKELGIKEPPPTKVTPERISAVMNEDTDDYSQRYHRKQSSNLVANIAKLSAGVLVIVGAVIMLSGYGDTLKDMLFGSDASVSELNADDVVHETNLRAMQLSAETYKAKLTDYGGLCTSVGIDRNLYTCSENANSYVIDVELTTGRYYCVDSTGYSGVVEEARNGKMACN